MAMSEPTRPEGEDEREGGFGDDPENDAPFAEDDPRQDPDDVPDAGELELDEGDRLPWLEVDDEEDEYSGYNRGQVIAFVMLALVVLGLFVGGIWWFSHRGPDENLVTDGSVVAAPDEPYKVKPEDPGGKTFEGTGDTSFAVSEGEARPAQLGQSQDGPKPGFETMGPAVSTAARPAATPPPTASAATGPGVGVQINAYSSRAAAEAGWRDLSQRHEALGGMRYRILEGKADIGTVYRLQAVADSAGSANALCGRLKASGLNCFVKD